MCPGLYITMDKQSNKHTGTEQNNPQALQHCSSLQMAVVVKNNATRVALCAALCILVMASSALSNLVVGMCLSNCSYAFHVMACLPGCMHGLLIEWDRSMWVGRLNFAVKTDCFHMDPCTFRKCADECLHRARTEDKPVKNSCDTPKECCCRYYEWHPSPPPPHHAGVAAAAEGDDGGFLGWETGDAEARISWMQPIPECRMLLRVMRSMI